MERRLDTMETTIPHGRTLRIDDSNGLELRVVTGCVWITQDHDTSDLGNDRMQYGLPERHDPTPEEIKRLMRVGECLQNQAFRDIPHGVNSWLTRVFRRREVESVHADTVANHARKVLFG